MNAVVADPVDGSRRQWMWVALIAVVLAFALLGMRGIWDPDEGRYTNVALNMLDSGNWLIPHRSVDTAHWTKPPLTYWAIAASIAAFGTTAFAARLPAALSYLLCVLLVGRMGRRLSRNAGPRAALVFATMLFPFGAAQMITTDYLLAAMETLAMTAFVEARFGATQPRRWLVLMWAAFGAAFLTKGPPGLLPLLPVIAFDWLTRTPNRPMLVRPLGLLAFAAIAAPWYIAVTRATPGLMGYFLGAEVVGRIATDDFKRHGEWYGWLAMYGPTVLIGTLPWWRPLWRAVRHVGSRIGDWRASREARIADAAWLLPALWFALPLLVFCISRSRLPLYILPLFPPLAIAVTLQHLRDDAPWPRPVAIAGWVLLLLALKIGSAYFPTHKNAREWAREIHARTHDPISDVLFVDDMTRYGLHLHLGRGVHIEKLSIEDVPEARFNPEYDKSLSAALRESTPAQLWICRQENWAVISARVRAAGLEPVPLGTPYQERVFFRALRR